MNKEKKPYKFNGNVEEGIDEIIRIKNKERDVALEAQKKELISLFDDDNFYGFLDIKEKIEGVEVKKK